MKRAFTLILCLSLTLCACSAEQFLEPGTFYYHRADIGYQGSEGVVAPEQRELSGISGDALLTRSVNYLHWEAETPEKGKREG